MWCIMNDLIHQFRKTSRSFVRELKLLSNPYMGINLNVAAIHLLLECDKHAGLTQQDVVHRLNLNKSYVSKLINKLYSQGLLSIDSNIHDKRKQCLTLTEKGEALLMDVEEEANQQVGKALSFLTKEAQDKALEGLSLYTQALRKSRLLEGITIRLVEKKDNKDLLQIISSVLAEFNANKEGFAFCDPELQDMHETYSKPGYVYLVAESNGELLGGVGVGPLQGGDELMCELKKMYLAPSARGLGLGEELLKQILTYAENMTYKSCYLETLSSMAKAIQLYRRQSFSFLNQPMGNTGHFGCDTWMLKQLGSQN